MLYMAEPKLSLLVQVQAPVITLIQRIRFYWVVSYNAIVKKCILDCCSSAM